MAALTSILPLGFWAPCSPFQSVSELLTRKIKVLVCIIFASALHAVHRPWYPSPPLGAPPTHTPTDPEQGVGVEGSQLGSTKASLFPMLWGQGWEDSCLPSSPTPLPSFTWESSGSGQGIQWQTRVHAHAQEQVHTHTENHAAGNIWGQLPAAW